MLIPLPSGRPLLRLVALAILLLIVVVLSPAILLWSLFPSGRTFLLQLLAELRTWATELSADERTAAPRERVPDQRIQDVTGPRR